MFREAGLTELPRNYFGAGPLRMATFLKETKIAASGHALPLSLLACETVIYSVGFDGVDNKALRGDVHPGWGAETIGDWVFRLGLPQSAISGK